MANLIIGDHKFRCWTTWDEFPNKYGSKSKYDFIWQKDRAVVLLNSSPAYDYSVNQNGDLVIWRQKSNDHIYDNEFKYEALVVKADRPVVIQLQKALMEEEEFKMLGGYDVEAP